MKIPKLFLPQTLLFILISLYLLGPLKSKAEVWKDTESWTPAWEKKYSDWVLKEWGVDIFTRPTLKSQNAAVADPRAEVGEEENPFFGLRTDCADTVYSMRIIFAYLNKLPIVFQDPTGGPYPITNKMKRWDQLSEKQKIRSFLRFIYDLMSTQSLPLDSYPVAINRNTLRPGIFLLTTHQNHHSWTLKQMLPIGVPWLIYNSTLGAGQGSTLQQRQSWPNPFWVFEGDSSSTGQAGFRDWRKPDSIGLPVWQVPGYSDEQYKINLSQWTEQIQKKIATTLETPAEQIERLWSTACVGVVTRVSAVNSALHFLSSLNSMCMSPDEFDNYSTPNRDHRVFDDLMNLRKAYALLHQKGQASLLSEKMQNQLDQLFPAIENSAKTETKIMVQRPLDLNSDCLIEYSQGTQMDLTEFKRRLFLGLISNNPHDDLAQRWGDVDFPSNRASQCPVYESWRPDLDHL